MLPSGHDDFLSGQSLLTGSAAPSEALVLTTCTIQTIFSSCTTATWIFSRALESTGQAQAIHPCTFRSHSIPLANSGHTPLAEEQRQKRQRAEEGFSCTCIDLTCCNTLPTVSSASQQSNCMTRKVCTMSGEYHAFSVYKYSNSFCIICMCGKDPWITKSLWI